MNAKDVINNRNYINYYLQFEDINEPYNKMAGCFELLLSDRISADEYVSMSTNILNALSKEIQPIVIRLMRLTYNV